MVITHKHMTQAKICLPGARRFFHTHNLDWKGFMRNGIDEKELLKLNDAMASRLVELANGRK